MSNKPKYDVPDVRKALDEIIAQEPEHRDERAVRKLSPRYMEHGQPCCLLGKLFHRLGVSKGVLKALDAETNRYLEEGSTLQWRGSQHPLKSKFTDDALALLYYLQDNNDAGMSWEKIRYRAFSPDKSSMWGPKYHVWLTPETAIEECGAIGPEDGRGRFGFPARCTLAKHKGRRHRDETEGLSWEEEEQ